MCCMLIQNQLTFLSNEHFQFDAQLNFNTWLIVCAIVNQYEMRVKWIQWSDSRVQIVCPVVRRE